MLVRRDSISPMKVTVRTLRPMRAAMNFNPGISEIEIDHDLRFEISAHVRCHVGSDLKALILI